MNHRQQFAAGLAAVAALVGGCATSPARDVARHDDGVDHPRIASVENAARGRGIDIHWINLPQRRPAVPIASEPSATTPPTGP